MKMKQALIASLLAGAIAIPGIAPALAEQQAAAAKQSQAEDGAELSMESEVALEDLFRPPTYTNIRISPDGRHFAAGMRREDGLTDGVIIDRRTMKVKSVLAIDGNIGVTGFRWANNERVLFHFTFKSATSEGDGVAAIAGMNVDGSRKDILWRGSDDYGGGEGAMLQGKIDKNHFRVAVYPSGTGLKFPYLYIYKLNIYTGKSLRIARSPIRSATPIFNKDKEITHWVGYQPSSYKNRVVATRNASGGWDENVYDESKGLYLPEGWVRGSDEEMWYTDTIEAPTKGLYRVNVETGERTLVYRHPKVDYDAIARDDDGNPWGAVVNYDYPTVVYIDEKNHYAQTHKKLQGTFPSQYVSIVNRTADNNEWVVSVRGDRDPGKYYLYNQFDGSLKFIADPFEWIDPANIPATHPVRFNARDGMEINGFLTLPVGKDPKKLPLIILPHGGPHGPRDYWRFDRESILFANAGYAVMHVNYRGSGGYGRDFEYDWYGHWGLEMQDDLTDATYWAIQSGIADRDRICIYGASYGGYASLMGVAKEPDLYQCSIGYVGVYDLNIFMHSGDVQMRKGGREYLLEAAGATEEKRAAQSPLTHVDRIEAPVFLVQGKRDVRVHWDHYVAMRDALAEKNHALETLVAPRAAHGARETDSQLEIYCRMIDFMDRHIGDRKPTDPPRQDCVPEGAIGLEYKYYEGVKRG
ncbi:alpha/beta hydrolase family protein [Microbulbifer elongatus]|uniref:alpha/beta hydrolase family protein n=1 Tax=Microbulbifer elongatus TaxID=86173 RepID=UPI001CFCC113|nr:prolyl oligopeptidase family serine peptidase [Microbulbifer elongatus]